MRLFGMFSMIILFSLSASCQSAKAEKTEPYTGDQPMFLVNVTGMSCMGCVATVTETISAQDGVEWVHVDLKKREASFAADPEKTDMQTLATAMEKAGYEITAPRKQE